MKQSTNLVNQQTLTNTDTKGIVSPLHTSTVFTMKQPSSDEGFQYGRVGNPTRLVLELNLARYAEAHHCLASASGSATISSVMMMLKSNDHIICHDSIYEGTQRIIVNHFQKFGITNTFVDLSKQQNLEVTLKKFPKTKVVMIESPTNPLLQIIDIKSICQIAHKHKVIVIVDNTFATSLLQKPLLLGADVVIESLSKNINGHSNVIGGMLATNDTDIFEKVKSISQTIGFTISPRDADQILLGMKTMQLRLDKQCENAEKVASFLEQHKNIKRILFPNINKTNSKQMERSGFIISFNLNKKESLFIKKLELIKIGHSFGGIETLIQQPTTMMDLSFSKSSLKKLQINDSFFRLSIGIEDIDDIINDLKNALNY